MTIPSGVTVTVDKAKLTVKGPKGTLSLDVPRVCKVAQEGSTVVVARANDEKSVRAAHGSTRAHIANMIRGVTEGFSKEMEIVGVGYKAEMKGKVLALTIGFSHVVNYPAPDGITIETPEPTKIKVSGVDRQRVGQVAAEIRGVRGPEPYKGKGIKYVGEYVERKAGKTAATGGAK